MTPKTFTITETVTVGSYTLRVIADESRGLCSINPQFFAPDEGGERGKHVHVVPAERRGPNEAEKAAFFATLAIEGESRADFDKRACALFMKNQYGIE